MIEIDYQTFVAKATTQHGALVSLPTDKLIGPALVADHQAALEATAAQVDHLREVLATLDTRLADHAGGVAERQRRVQEAHAARLLGEVAPDLGAEDTAPPLALEQGLRDDQAARAGLDRRLTEALEAQTRVQALTPRLRETVLAQEIANLAAKHHAAALKEEAIRTSLNGLEAVQAQWSGRTANHHAPPTEHFEVGARETELARLRNAWAPLF